MEKKKILLIEDDALTRELYQEILEQEGFDLTIASDGQEGYDKASKGGFDLILLDIMMPKMDGVTLLGKLKENPPAVKNGNVLLLTNLEHDAVINEALNLGAASYFVKSNLTPGQVLEKIKTYLNTPTPQSNPVQAPVPVQTVSSQTQKPLVDSPQPKT